MTDKQVAKALWEGLNEMLDDSELSLGYHERARINKLITLYENSTEGE